MHIHDWQPGVTYQPGTVVTYQGQAYQRLDGGDDSEPDDNPGGWQLLENTNLDEYRHIEESMSSYEARREAHKAEVIAALEAEGLDPDDVRVVLNAS